MARVGASRRHKASSKALKRKKRARLLRERSKSRLKNTVRPG
jgi:hypothetical protein